MPQTSLLSFLGSSTTGTPGSLPGLKPRNVPPSRHQDEIRTKGVLLERTTTQQLALQTPTAGTLTTLTNEAGGKRSVNDNEEAKGRQSSETTGTVTNHLPSPASATAFSLPHCPSITIRSIQPDHLPALKRLTSTLLPIKYPDSFYNDAISDPTAAPISRVAVYTPPSSPPSTFPIPIGWIRCSLEPYPQPSSPKRNTSPIYNQIYIKALCLLAPYRHIGVAAALLENILREQDVLRQCHVQVIFAHVWESNEEALEWYEKRGFARDVLVQGYYRKLRPGGAWLVRKEV
ncbi:hypothetical protein GJ744_004885 [Endocarpon pusillum]|uniref:N-acetyltransferase domain-containing protein n=1 Tax=Endocarpon pusillum TaxID=364733 RepID=A0A8H7ALF1_9EURO|nr:hypothetical protein GJ744_004885 [Endocarpon pusillum]